ncbi:hypothetical protein DDI_0698 [Dickeya dianthicola RNS04.9]|nr:hypothetical protein DDI_0698 [Dickeya dianthicola RNS04.9]
MQLSDCSRTFHLFVDYVTNIIYLMLGSFNLNNLCTLSIPREIIFFGSYRSGCSRNHTKSSNQEDV